MHYRISGWRPLPLVQVSSGPFLLTRSLASMDHICRHCDTARLHVLPIPSDSVFPWRGTGCVARSFSGCGGGEQSLRRKHAHHRYPRHVTTTRIMLGCHQGSSCAPSSRSQDRHQPGFPFTFGALPGPTLTSNHLAQAPAPRRGGRARSLVALSRSRRPPQPRVRARRAAALGPREPRGRGRGRPLSLGRAKPGLRANRPG